MNVLCIQILNTVKVMFTIIICGVHACRKQTRLPNLLLIIGMMMVEIVLPALIEK